VQVENTSGSVPTTVNVSLDAAKTSSWMITDDSGYGVRFTGTADWAGKGPTGYIINSDASSKKNKRLGW